MVWELFLSGSSIPDAAKRDEVQGADTCPPGEGSVSAYNLTAVKGTFANGQSTSSFGQGDRSAQVTVPTGQSGNVLVTYTVTCSGGPSGERTSGTSPEASAAIQVPDDGGDNSGEGGEGGTP